MTEEDNSQTPPLTQPDNVSSRGSESNKLRQSVASASSSPTGRVSVYHNDEQADEAAMLKELQERKSKAKKDFYYDIAPQIDSHKVYVVNVSADCSIERRGRTITVTGPQGQKEISLLYWYPKESGRHSFKDLTAQNVTGTELAFAEKSGVLLKLSKELGYFGYTTFGERFQERQITLKGGFLSYGLVGKPEPIYSIPLQDCYVEINAKGNRIALNEYFFFVLLFAFIYFIFDQNIENLYLFR